jgi:hypothetical protein
MVAILTQGIKELSTIVSDTKSKLDGILVWFKGGNLNIQKDVCVDEVCVTKDQFKQMLRNAGNIGSPTTFVSSPSISSVESNDVVPTSTPSVETSTTTSSDSIPTSEPVVTSPEPTPEAPTTPAPEPTPEPAPTPAPESTPAPTE